MTAISRPLRLAEAVGALSLATDLAMGQPLEHGLRTAVLAVRIARVLGLPEDDQVTVFYTGLLHFAGCTAESEIDARFFGDELAARPRMMAAAFGTRMNLIATAARMAHPERTRLARAAAMARSAFGGIAEFRNWAASHCDVASVLGARMGFSEPIQDALRHLWERWDGRGMPGDLRGSQIPLAVRLMQVAQDADMAWQQGGISLADEVLADRAGSGLDPGAVAAFFSLGEAGYRDLDAPSIWEHALHAEPGPQPVVTEERLDACLSAIADFADLKSMWTLGHSRGVATLAEQAGEAAGLPVADQVSLRRAGLVHDIGRVAVPVNVWAKRGPLNRDEYEQVRLHAYHTERVLDAAAGLRPLARLAGSHGERCDGTGYHRGNRAAELPMTAWLLATADCYQAMREPRPHRPALAAAAAADELAREAAAGRLAPEAVRAVLTAAGQPAPGRSAAATGPWPAGLEPGRRDAAGREAAGAPASQPGAGQPGTSRPGAGQPGVSQPGPSRPGAGRPGTGQPRTGRPGTGRPGLTQPGAGWPTASSAGARRPEAGPPGARRPGTGQPGLTQPGAGRPTASPAGAGPPGASPAGAGRPGAGPPEGSQAGTGRPAARPAGRRPAGLSERECEVLGLLARGLATKQVARRLGISPKTCDHHIQRLYGKVGVSTRAGATMFALEHGLVDPGETAIP
jgi:HD-GYP domain-containing protein (c-di-GMP phosphodiesterase class II)/DNA-binding CsgD family transcriptional regulator